MAAFFAFTDHSSIAGALSVVITLLTAASLFLTPTEKARAHKDSGEKYLALRNEARLFASVKVPYGRHSQQALVDKLESLIFRKNELNASSPSLPDWAYKIAKSKIEKGHADYDADRSNKCTAR